MEEPTDDLSRALQRALADVSADPLTNALFAAIGHAESSDQEEQDPQDLPNNNEALVATPAQSTHISALLPQADDPYSIVELRSEIKHISHQLHLSAITSTFALSDAMLKFDHVLQNATDEQLAVFQDPSKETHSFIDEQIGLGNQVHMQSSRADAAANKRSRKKLEPLRHCCSAAQIEIEHHMGNKFLTHMVGKVTDAGGTAMVYYERHRGDETPYAKLTVEAPSDANAVCDKSLAEIEDSKDWATQAYDPKDARVAAKVWQRRLEIGALFRFATGQHFLVTFELTCPLASITNCDGECYYDLFRRISNVLPARTLFQRQQRISDSDGDGAIERAERVMSVESIEDGTKPVSTLRGKCRQHRIYHNTSKPFKLKERFQQKCIHAALALRGPNLLKRFKKLYTRNITANVEYIFEDPPLGPGRAADAHMERVYAIYLASLEDGSRRKWASGPHFTSERWPTVTSVSVGSGSITASLVVAVTRSTSSANCGSMAKSQRFVAFQRSAHVSVGVGLAMLSMTRHYQNTFTVFIQSRHRTGTKQ